MKVYLPTSSAALEDAPVVGAPKPGSIRVVQALVTPSTPTRQPQTLGTALNAILPTIFPSRRSPLLAQPVLHGAVAPMSAPVKALGEAAAYADGFLHVVVVMMA
ncbi:hypothetical protein LTR28_012116 [Elasticomyces elasticus]|nr:hypothetical protein LTR28_012116 [Elasticomyces elasticus]